MEEVLIKSIEETRKDYYKWKKYMLEHIDDDEIVTECCSYLCGKFEDIRKMYRDIEDLKRQQNRTKIRIEALKN